MKNKILIAASLFSLSTLTFGFDPITPNENEKLMKGETIQYVKWKEGYVWPQVSMRVLLDHKPEENMTEFRKFETHNKYIPDVLESKVVKTINPDNFHVYLAMEMPWPVKKSEQVTNNVLTRATDGAVTLTWNLVSGEFVKATNGHVTFKPYNGKTLMEYETFIVPNSSLAGMFKNRVATDVEKTVKEISKHLNKSISGKTENRLPASL